ncbi:DUF3011 domain-containing protein [Paucibacter sp. B2R-40]|uniref:DUF3011 domain-containing protein n=1 Tax=Paucibacter sp. B2R-40 TaxID=2893554 RepID=UPI0021E3BB4A|nr:DUF3011 domain-containing protein [Paucibacter sp. B2R-40]MCV2352862.1 DUF3011 domain-containing protein [Paucibacter sp. B2R-40]
MIRNFLTRPLSGLICVAMVAVPLPARAEQTIRCESRGFNYRYCRVDTDDRVELSRQLSSISCRENRSWGYDRYGVWVDHGCAAEFRVGKDDNNHRSRDKAIGIGVAVVGLAALAAMASSRNQQATQEGSEVQNWAVGSFSGYDETERTPVQLTILPGGSVKGRAGNNEFTGQLSGDQLQAGRQRFKISRQGQGFLAVDVNNPQHRVQFNLAGGGY